MSEKTVLCFGDSNTYGTKPMPSLSHDERFGRDIRWPQVMASTLGADWHLVEEGHPGRTSLYDDPIEGKERNGARVLRAIIESHRPIDFFLLMLGANDQKARFGLGAQDIALGLGRLLDMALSTGFIKNTVLIAPPKLTENGVLAEMFSGAQARSERLACELAKIAQSRKVHFFDASAHIETDPIDGVHFSAKAHLKLGQELAQFLRDIA